METHTEPITALVAAYATGYLIGLAKEDKGHPKSLIYVRTVEAYITQLEGEAYEAKIELKDAAYELEIQTKLAERAGA